MNPKNVLKGKKKRFDQPDSSGSDEDDETEPPTQKISKSKAKIKDMEKKHKDLEEQFETMKRGIIEAASKKADTDTIDALRKKNDFEMLISFLLLFIFNANKRNK